MASPARIRHLTTTHTAALSFYSSVLREWELLREEVKQGNLNGIILFPASCAATHPLILQKQKLLQKQLLQRHKVRNGGNKHADPSSSSLLGFQLFLLGGSSSSSDDDDEAEAKRKAAQVAPPSMGTLVLGGYIFVNSSSSPWYGGCFEFKIHVPPGYTSGLASPSVLFVNRLSHPELRNGTHLTVSTEIFAAAKRVSCPFMLREMLDAIRELFIQPLPLFSKEVLAAAALDVKYHSATSSFGGMAETAAFGGDVLAAEQHFRDLNSDTGGRGSLDDDDDMDQTLSPAQKYMRQEHRAIVEEKHHEHDGPRTRPPPFLLHSDDLGMIFGEAHVPFLVMREQQKQDQQNGSVDEKKSAVAASSSLEDVVEKRAMDETAWLSTSTFDKFMTRRLTRQLMPSVAHS